ncbi:MAG: PQQ-dependent sugar dehydrogenase [Gemmatimonadota bacterium]
MIDRGTGRSVLTLAGLAAAALAGGCDDDPIGPGDSVVTVEQIATGLTSPVLLREAPDGSDRLFVVDQIGVIRVIGADGALATAPFLDVRSQMVDQSASYDERGLLGLAFHPQFATNGRLYAYYSAPLRSGAPSGFNHTARVSEFRVTGNVNAADPGSERILLEVDQPQSNHNAGTVAFGPDGYLYISLGDGGGSDDVGNGHVDDWYAANAGGNSQNVEANLLGKILRIDVDGGMPYDIPSDNPFVGEPGRDEIWAYGLRNPYRFSFDMGGTGELIAGDAGQNLWEEVNVIEGGGNYGWNVKEASSCFNTDDPETPRTSCPAMGQFDEPLIDPVIEYGNTGSDAGGPGIAVVAGYVYRGSDIPGLAGTYIFGDFSRSFNSPDGTLFTATPAAVGDWAFEELTLGAGEDRLGQYVLGFGQDLEGEVYVLTSGMAGPTGTTGRVYKLVVL